MKTSKYNYITELEALGLIMADTDDVYILKKDDVVKVANISEWGIAVDNNEKFYTVKNK